MNRADFDRSVRAGFTMLLELGLSSWDRQVSLRSMDPPDEYRRIIFSAEADYDEIFKAGLQYRAYNFLLEDYSYFQFWHGSGHKARSLRYMYCPNPFEAVELEEILLENLGRYNEDEVFHQALEEASLKIGRPPIRYELALDDRIEVEHPAAHFTVGGHTENHWPVSRVLTPKLFMLFVCKHYYGIQWSAMGSEILSVEGFSNHLDQALADEKRASHLLGEESFSFKERLHLFIE